MPRVKTVRFARVVAKAGKPTLHITWMPPDKDPALAKAAKTHRLLTLHQTLRGSRKDYGTVGLHVGDKAQFLIFPKSLKALEDRRVIAIDYDVFAGKTVAAGSFQPARVPKRAATKRAMSSPAAQRLTDSEAEESPPTDEPEPAEAPEAPTPRSEIEKAIAELKARKPRAAIRRLEDLLTSFPEI